MIKKMVEKLVGNINKPRNWTQFNRILTQKLDVIKPAISDKLTLKNIVAYVTVASQRPRNK
jgi:hypothetical protein